MSINPNQFQFTSGAYAAEQSSLETPRRKRPNSSVGFAEGGASEDVLVPGRFVMLRVLDVSADGTPSFIDSTGRVYRAAGLLHSSFSERGQAVERPASLPPAYHTPPESARSGREFPFTHTSRPASSGSLQQAIGEGRPTSSLSYTEQYAADTAARRTSSFSLQALGVSRPNSGPTYTEQVAASRAAKAATASRPSSATSFYTAPSEVAQNPSSFSFRSPSAAISVPPAYPTEQRFPPLPLPLNIPVAAAAATGASAMALPPFEGRGAIDIAERLLSESTRSQQQSPFVKYAANSSISMFLSKPQMKLEKDASDGDLVTFNSFDFLPDNKIQLNFRLNSHFNIIPTKYTSCIFCYYDLPLVGSFPKPTSQSEIKPEDIVFRCGYDLKRSYGSELSYLNIYIGFKKPFEGLMDNIKCKIYTKKHSSKPLLISDCNWSEFKS